MKRPAFQFYPADWRKDVELRACSPAARGLWIDMMCIAHECEPYGHLTVNGKAMTTAEIAKNVGISSTKCANFVKELLEKGVARRNQNGTIFCKRMVEDERVRIARAEGGKAGATYGAKGAEHGVKGGRPKAETGDAETPLKTPLQTPLDIDEKPPPSSSSSSSASTFPPPDGGGSGSLLRIVPPTPPPEFDGSNLEALNGKAVVPISAAWELPEQWGIDAESLGWKPAEVLREAEKFRQYWTAGKGEGKRRSVKGWRQSWSNWLEKAAERVQR